MDQESDRQLITLIAAKDRTAVASLFGRYQACIFRFIQRIVRQEAVAEELTNEVFLEIWRSAGRFSGHSKVATWIMAIARNKALNHLRHRNMEPLEAHGHTALFLEDPDDLPDVAAVKKDKSAIMRACIDRLSVEHREVLYLVYYQEHTVGEVAEIVGIPMNTVKTRMFHARKKLGEMLKRAGIDRGWP